MTNIIYEEIAKKYGVSADEVKTEIQKIIDISCKDDVPTTEEFMAFILAHMVNHLLKKQD